ncbi:MAG: serine hydrolase [Taibaiella sp.]|nr:serine hydrolase [Taibaiella sp.]
MKKSFFFFFFLLFSFCSVQAQFLPQFTNEQIATGAIDSLFYGRKGFDKMISIIGASVGVYYKGSNYYFSYGYADKDKKNRIDTSTIFEIGSNTKVFTALLLANEIVKGKVNPNSYIDDYFAVNKAIQKKVKVMDLATYTSGLPSLHDSASLVELNKIDSTYPLYYADSSYLMSLLSKTEHLDNHGQYAYSNTAFGLLGYVLSGLHHTSYDELMERELFIPMKLNHTSCKLDSTGIHMSKGYEGENRMPYGVFSGLAAAGAIKSNVTDMLQFLRYQLGQRSQFSKAIEMTHKVYATNNALQLGSPVNVAMGWHITKLYHDDVYVMRGDTYGYSSLMVFDKAKDLAFILMLNTKNSNTTSTAMTKILRSIIEKTPEYSQRFAKPIVNVNDEILHSYAGEYSLFPGFTLMVTVDDGKIYTQGTGQPQGVILPVSNNWFISKQDRAEFEFVKDAKGKVVKLILYQGGQELTALKK